MASHESLLRSLYARGHRGVDLGLDRVRVASRTLGDPHRDLTVLHVAGTNGKGSTCAMLDAIVRKAGLTVGLYTSPHLARLTERIRVGGEEVSEDIFDRGLERVLRDAPQDLTFFETMTLTAFLLLRDVGVDVAVLEVGLGGRLDATNIVERPLVTGITSITTGEDGRNLEHAALLGDTVEAIAAEKAGIAKTGVPLVVGEMSIEARRVILGVAENRGAGPVCLAPAMPDGRHVVLRPALAGQHQIANAAVAAAMAAFAARTLPISTQHIEEGIASAQWPGRLERMSIAGRQVILDCAHNIEGVRAVAHSLAELDPSRTTLVFGALADKSWAAMLRTLAPVASRRIYTLPSGRAPAGIDALQLIAPGLAEPDPLRAADLALEQTAVGETVVVAGSIYLVGAVRAHWLGVVPDPVIAL